MLAQQVFLAQIGLVPGDGEGFYVDGWDGYVASRDRVLEYVQREGSPVTTRASFVIEGGAPGVQRMTQG